MTGEVNLFGVYVPGLLLMALLALVATGLMTRLLGLIGAYRLFAYRPLVDVALFVLVLGLLVLVTTSPEFLP